MSRVRASPIWMREPREAAAKARRRPYILGPDGVVKVFLSDGSMALIDEADAYRIKWANWTASRPPGKAAYAIRRDGSKNMYLHREVLGDSALGRVADHMSGDGLDCRRENLRCGDHMLNNKNIVPPKRGNTPHMGVSLDRRYGTYLARIGCGGKTHHLGTYRTAEAALAARLEAERRLWGIQPRRASAHAEVAP